MPAVMILVTENRKILGSLYVEDDDGQVVLGPFPVAALADDGVARLHGNAEASPLLRYGNTPAGIYKVKRLVSMRGASVENVRDYGRFGVVVLAPFAGDALLAEAAGRLEVWIHGGAFSEHGLIKRTNGAVRLNNTDHHRLMKFMAGKEGMTVTIREIAATLLSNIAYVDASEAINCGDPPAMFEAYTPQPSPFYRATLPAAVFLGEYDSGTNYSNIDTNYTNANEGKTHTKAYNLGSKFPKSGITIAAGIDLGQFSATQNRQHGKQYWPATCNYSNASEFCGSK